MPQHQPLNRSVAALLGNGLSIAFNDKLAIPNLTAEIRARFRAAGSAAGRAAPDRVLARLAAGVGETGDPNHDFEALIGPFDQHRENLDALRQLVEALGQESPSIRKAWGTVDSAVQRVHRVGVGHALDIIEEHSYAGGLRMRIVENFMAALRESAGPGVLTVGNLSYDSLVMAAMCRLFPRDFCDMARGYQHRRMDLGDSSILGQPLRTDPSDFPWRRRSRLVHLHGSLTWLREPTSGRVFKFGIEPLRDVEYWTRWRDGELDWTPEVVLTNQAAKTRLVEGYPFKLAYDVLYQDLLTADRWLIAGYSFRDECVNDLLAKAWRHRRMRVPQVLVVTLEDSPSRDVITEAIGWDPIRLGDPPLGSWLRICRHGVVDAPACATWQRWDATVQRRRSA